MVVKMMIGGDDNNDDDYNNDEDNDVDNYDLQEAWAQGDQAHDLEAEAACDNFSRVGSPLERVVVRLIFQKCHFLYPRNG